MGYHPFFQDQYINKQGFAYSRLFYSTFTKGKDQYINKQEFAYSRLSYSTFSKGKDESIVAKFNVESEDTSKSPSRALRAPFFINKKSVSK